MKKLSALILAAILTLLLVVPAMAASTGPYNLEVPESLEKYYHKYDPTITITQNQSGTEDIFYPGDNWSSNQYTEWILGVAGIVCEPAWEAADYDTNVQKLTIAMATGDLPDLISTDKATIKQLAEAGLIIDVADLFDEYASPLVKALYQTYIDAYGDSIYDPVTIGGKQMALVNMSDQVGPSNLWYRVDVLNELGYQIPSTLAELEEIFAAYKAVYPDNTCFRMTKDMYNANNIYGAYGAYKGIWIEADDGSLVYGSVQPEVKKALATLHDWYVKGYIDPEFMVKDASTVEAEFISGNMLCYEDYWWTIWGLAPSTLANLPDAILEGGPILVGPDGDAGAIQSPSQYQYLAISATCEHPEAAIIMLNWAVDSALRNDESFRSKVEMVYPEEARKSSTNADYLTENGLDIVYQENDYEFPGIGGASTYFWNRGSNRITYGLTLAQTYQELSSEMAHVSELLTNESIERTAADEALLKIYESYFLGYDMLKINGGANAAYLAEALTNGLAKIDAFQGVTTKTMSEKSAYLEKLEAETFVRIITGEYDLDAFDEFVNNWMKNGGEQITQEVNEWYHSLGN